MIQARKDFFLLDYINDIIERLVEHGLVFKWLENSQNYSFPTGEHKRDEIPLTIDHTLASFVILGVGLTLGMFVFILEQSKLCRGKKVQFTVEAVEEDTSRSTMLFSDYKFYV